MTKLITASLYFHLAAIFSYLLPQLLKPFSVFVETPFFNWRCPKGC